MKQVLSVGQCGMDHRTMDRFFRSHFDLSIVPVATAIEATNLMRQQPFDLVLVNRQFDADCDEGIDLIDRMKADPELSGVPVMLITNFPEYAQQAVEKGALPGFGKADLTKPELVARLRTYL